MSTCLGSSRCVSFRGCPSSLPALGQISAGLPGLTGRLAALVVVCQLVARSASAAPTAAFLQTVVHAAAIVHLAVVVLPLCATEECRQLVVALLVPDPTSAHLTASQRSPHPPGRTCPPSLYRRSS